MDYLSLCLIVKDENLYLPEWLDYHSLIGVEHFYIYDNGSQVPVRESLAEWIARGRVTVTEISGGAQQLFAYDHCLRAFGPNSCWIGFIDTDEFLVPKTTRDLRVFLQNYERFGGLAVNWVMFGSNGHLARPDGGMIANYTLRSVAGLVENRTIKSIVQPARTEIPFSPHHFGYRAPFYCVNERQQRVDNQTAAPYAETIQLNHYYIRSKAEYIAKLERGRGDGGTPYDLKRFDYINQHCRVEDTAILNLVEECTNTPIPVSFESGADRPVCLHPDLPRLLHERAAALPAPANPEAHPSAGTPLRSERMIWFRSLDLAYKKAKDEDNSAEIERLLLEAVRHLPTMVTLYSDLASLYLKLGHPQTAWEVLASAWKIAPGSLDVLLPMGEYFHKIGQHDRAENTLRLAAEQDPLGARTLGSLANLLSERGKLDEACAVLERIIDHHPYASADTQVLSIVKSLGMTLYSQGFVDRAEHIFDLALQHNPDDCELMVNLAKISYDRRQFPRARSLLERAARIDPNDTEVQLGLAMLNKRAPAPRPAA